ncbi:Uncharacterised protein [Kluyvera cryocrescens]|nr:Uncharacterised protein [Kluyvera cryocrescens]
MRNIGFRTLQSTNKERIHAVVLTQSEGQLSQHGVVFIAKRQRRFTFFIQHRVSAEINAVALLVFSLDRGQQCAMGRQIVARDVIRKFVEHQLVVVAQGINGLLRAHMR